jgi:NADPH:quinone reductase
MSLREGLNRLTGGRGVDVLYDPVGGELADSALRSMAWKGRYLVIGFAGGEIPKIPLNLVLLKGCDVQGVFWGSFVDREPAAQAANMAWLLDRVAKGGLSARVHAIFPLAETPAALGVLARREAKGKVLVRGS